MEKKGNIDYPKKYRPIKLVTSISKIIEGLLNTRIINNIPNPAANFQHAYTKNKSTTTAILSLEDIMFRNNLGFSAVIMVDLKGAFETVSHTAIKHLFSKFDQNLSIITESYLNNRKAIIMDSNFPHDTPKLEYLQYRSTPQGSKVSPTIFSYNSGLITKWFLDLFDASNNPDIYCNIVVYADDAAIYLSTKTQDKLITKIPKIVNTYTKIANTYGADLEPSKTEILMTKSMVKNIKEIDINNIKIKTESTIKWLGYHISINKKNCINITIPTSKICALKNSVRLFQLYNKKIEDNIDFYSIYLRPIIDLWFLDPNIVDQIEKIEAQILKQLACMPFTTSTEGIYKQLAIVKPSDRIYKFAKNLETKNILHKLKTNKSKLKSGKTRIIESCFTLNNRLMRICIEKTPVSTNYTFDPKTFCNWRVQTIKQIQHKIQYNIK